MNSNSPACKTSLQAPLSEQPIYPICLLVVLGAVLNSRSPACHLICHAPPGVYIKTKIAILLPWTGEPIWDKEPAAPLLPNVSKAPRSSKPICRQFYLVPSLCRARIFHRLRFWESCSLPCSPPDMYIFYVYIYTHILESRSEIRNRLLRFS